jgi:hypothetical protein
MGAPMASEKWNARPALFAKSAREGFFGVKRRSRPLCAASRSPVAQAENRRIITGSKLIGRRRRQFGHSSRLHLMESAQKSRMVFWPGKVRPLGI